MKNNAELPKIRISSELHQQISNVIESLNKNESHIEITLAQFRRMAYESFIKQLKKEGLELKWKPS